MRRIAELSSAVVIKNTCCVTFCLLGEKKFFLSETYLVLLEYNLDFGKILTGIIRCFCFVNKDLAVAN